MLALRRARAIPNGGRIQMKKAKPPKFTVGDHVKWNSEAGPVSGTIIKVHLNNVEFKGYTHHANPSSPQYEIKSDRSEHIALHQPSALTLSPRR
jgi:hypothetical protein